LPKEYLPGETPEQRKQRLRQEKGWKKAPQVQKPVSPPPPPKPKTKPQSVPSHIPRARGVTKIDNTPLPTHDIAFVLGNGTSRAKINVQELVGHGTIYGCNALYREFTPDYLIAVDTKMIREITTAGAQETNNVWTNANKYTRELKGINLFNPNLGWSSGPTALNFASHNGAKTVYILGFDYVGIGVKNELVNNIYSGTDNYKKVNDRATYYGNWQRQTSMVIKRFPSKRYIRVVETVNSFVPDALIGLDNLEHITVEKFKKIFKIS